MFNPHRNGTENLTDPLAAGAVLFNNGEFKSAIGKICEETVWLLGIEGAQWFARLRARDKKITSFALQSSGAYAMCSAQPSAQQLVIDAGPQGFGRAGHGHADALSVQLTIDEHPVLIDPGASVYVGPDHERNNFRGTAAHNTLYVDGLNQAEPAGPFGWKHLPVVKVNRWLTGETFDFFSGWHNGYTRLSNPVSHYRYVFYLKPHFWLVRDVLTGHGSHRAEVGWHFAPGVLSPIPGGAQFCNGRSDLTLLYAVEGTASEISQDQYSPVYGQKESAPTFRVSADTRMPVEFATLLIPAGPLTQSPGLLQSFAGQRSGVQVQTYVWSRAGGETYIFFADQSGSWRIGPWSSDAQFVYSSMDASRNLIQFILCDGSYLELCGQRIFNSKTIVARGEWLSQAGGQQFSCSDESAEAFQLSILTAQHC